MKPFTGAGKNRPGGAGRQSGNAGATCQAFPTANGGSRARGLAGGEKLVLERVAYQVGVGAQAQLLKDAGAVGGDGLGAD